MLKSKQLPSLQHYAEATVMVSPFRKSRIATETLHRKKVVLDLQENCEFPDSHGMVIGNARQNKLPLD
jgi:hypothetical protein